MFIIVLKYIILHIIIVYYIVCMKHKIGSKSTLLTSNTRVNQSLLQHRISFPISSPRSSKTTFDHWAQEVSANKYSINDSGGGGLFFIIQFPLFSPNLVLFSVLVNWHF